MGSSGSRGLPVLAQPPTKSRETAAQTISTRRRDSGAANWGITGTVFVCNDLLYQAFSRQMQDVFPAIIRAMTRAVSRLHRHISVTTQNEDSSHAAKSQTRGAAQGHEPVPPAVLYQR